MRSLPPKSLTLALAHIAAGGRLLVPTAYRVTVIDKRVLARFDGLLKEEGNGYRMRSGRGSVYLLPGQLCFED